MNLRQLAYGILSFVPGIPVSLYRGTGGTNSAAYCYCIWLRHLVLAHSGGMHDFPSTVAELGPGDSIGVGLAALLSGAERYRSLDVISHAHAARNLQVFDELLEMFHRRAPIPGRDIFPEIGIELDSLDFPAAIIGEVRLRAALQPDRVTRLRRIVSGELPDAAVIDYSAPWNDISPGSEATIDFLISNAVMEHVMDLESAYRAMAQWLAPGGFASHQIDFRSHSLFNTWDGHWACPDWLWALFMGRRAYLLNREPFSTHRELAAASGLEERRCIRLERAAESPKAAARFQFMSAQDRITCGSYLLLYKPKI